MKGETDMLLLNFLGKASVHTQLLGLNIGFWVSMGITLLLVIIMNVVFWGMKPKNTASSQEKSELSDKK